MSSIKIKEFIKLDQIRSTKSIKIIQNIFQYSCIIAAFEGKWLYSRRCKEWAVLWKRWRVLASWCALLKPTDFQMQARSDPTVGTDGWTFGYLPWPFVFEHRFEWEDVRNFIGRHKKHQSKIQKVLWQISSKICVVRASEEPSKTFFLGRFWSKLAVEPLLESGQTTMNTFPLAKIAAALTKQWGYLEIIQCWGWGEGAEDFEGPWWLGISRYS